MERSVVGQPGLSESQSQAVDAALKEYWGFTGLRPLQDRAIAAALAGRDSLVVMPTGGGKSLCYQAPALLGPGLTVVVSPLIALMKDQVDGLKLIGYPADALNSTTSAGDSRRIHDDLAGGALRLLFVSPERLFVGGFLDRLDSLAVRSFAIDEAHCISQWGHDFRPEYRRLRELRARFPKAALHAFTATATPHVREDIAAQLGLRDPAVLVGVFDRPNLTYRILPRVNLMGQLKEACERHRAGGTIVYCISRKDTEAVAQSLVSMGIDAAPYHAGMDAGDRRRVQERFSAEELNVVAATVAFGMGIDRSNVRCVAHAALPKSVEHYQQETGRAGRDGLPAECLLLYSAADVQKWHRIMEMGAQESGAPPEWLAWQKGQVEEVRRLCTSAACRHKLLSEYFGQHYAPPGAGGCGACDVCLGELDAVPDSREIARKILSCVARMNMSRAYDGSPMSYGGAHLASVLMGKNLKGVREWGHDKLSTFGLLAEHSKDAIASYVNQLIDQGLLVRSAGQFATLSLGAGAKEVLVGDRAVGFLRPKETLTAEAAMAPRGGEAAPIDSGVFEMLRTLRRQIAGERGVPPYIIFGDAPLMDMARTRPTTPESFRSIKGVGDHKAAEFGPRFCAAIAEHCRGTGAATDVPAAGERAAPRAGAPGLSPAKHENFRRFERGESIEAVVKASGLALSTVYNHLNDFIQTRRPPSVEAWIAPAAYDEILTTAERIGAERLRPIFEHFGGAYTYDQLRLVLGHASATGRRSAPATPIR